jgi:hypothetical protein
LAVIWKFFVASIIAGCVTVLVANAMPQFAMAFGVAGALLRMVSISLLFFGLYFVGVIALHKGLKPINETVRLLRDLLPQNMLRRASPEVGDTQGARVIPAWCPEATSQAGFVDFSGNDKSKA